jgi:hypothetical protein
MTREQWLNNAVRELQSTVFIDHEVPEILVSIGFPSRRATSNKNRVIGQCFNKEASQDKETYHIFITPLLNDGVEVLAVLTHEIIHALLPMGTGHKAPFVKIMKAIGLEGKPTATVPGKDLECFLTQLIANSLGEFPHIGLNAKDMQLKKQTTRLLKVFCPVCGCLARMTMKWLLDPGPPVCGCGTDMEVDVP